MKKKYVTLGLASMMLLGHMPLQLAANIEGTTPADVMFTSKADPSNQQLPGDGGEITPLDPENPEEVLPPTGNDGMLRIDFVSNFYFGKQQATLQEDKTYYAAAQPYKQVDEDGNETRDLVNNYVQVTDNRGDSEASWKLYVKQDNVFKTAKGEELVGAQLSIGALGLETTADGGGTRPTLAAPNGTEENAGRYVLDPAEAVQLIDGQAGEGAGTWFVELGKTLKPNDGSYGQYAEGITSLSEDLQLFVPGSSAKPSQGEYRTTLTWTLQDVPGENQATDPIAITPITRFNLDTDGEKIKPSSYLSGVDSTLVNSTPTYSIENSQAEDTTINPETGELFVGMESASGIIIRLEEGEKVERYLMTFEAFQTNQIINVTGKEGVKIDWKIVKDQDNQVLMVTNTTQGEPVEFDIFSKSNVYYDEATDTSSGLKEAMDKFYEDMIATSELSNFVGAVDLSADTSGEDYTQLSSNGLKTAFPLTLGDVTETWTTNDERIATTEEGVIDVWWLRSPGIPNSSNPDNLQGKIVIDDGTFEDIQLFGGFGMRPALYLNLESDIE